MKAVILAAGLCSRIRAVTASPKCLLEFNGRAILDYQLASLNAAGVEEFAIVVGYKKQEIIEHIASYHAPLLDRMCFIVNQRFSCTNNIYSLYLAADWIGRSKVVCLNADVLYHPRIIIPALNNAANISMIVDDEYKEETMKVIIRDEYVVEMRKGIPREQASGTYIGITTFAAPVVHPLMREIEDLVNSGHEREFFNVAVQRLISKGAKVSYTSTALLPWAEIDDPGDYRSACRFDWGAMYDTWAETSVASSVMNNDVLVERLRP